MIPLPIAVEHDLRLKKLRKGSLDKIDYTSEMLPSCLTCINL